MRKCGVLMHISSLPGAGGIGTLGRAAFDFIDFAADAGINIWQMLPVGPTLFAYSPYQSDSTFAGNPLLIDLTALERDGLLEAGEYTPLPAGETVDFEAVAAQSEALLRRAFARAGAALADKIDNFAREKPWLDGYALFQALKRHFGGISWMEWPDEALRRRDGAALARHRELLKDEIGYQRFCQYIFFEQWEQLRAYAKEKGVELMGDMPIYVAEDSADVWLNPELFELDEDVRPIRIAGVPPDYFQADGQRWGNPLYNWKAHEKTGFAWWLARLRAAGEMFDIVRIDHFIGFANYYAIPATEPTARNGKYEIGPGMKLFRRVQRALPGLRIVAEDLGVVNPRVKKLLKATGYPGMCVAQFGFDSRKADDDSLPCNFEATRFAYTGTHDNPTTAGWWEMQDEDQKAYIRRALRMPANGDDIATALSNAVWASKADVAIVPVQDLLGLGTSARMNFPGTVGGSNWLWRLPEADYAALARRVRVMNLRYGRGKVPGIDASAIAASAEAFARMKHHCALKDCSAPQLHEAVADAVMLAIAPRWADADGERETARRAVYLSAEYLVGRLVFNNLLSLELLEPLRAELRSRGAELADLEDIEDAALGNGGLGRLAACFMDSAATHGVPLTGYGLRYRYGLFRQRFEDGRQIELPDDWTRYGDPWSIRRDELAVDVAFKDFTVRAVPYDMPVIGYGGRDVLTLRLWQCESAHEFDFERFNARDYAAACADKNRAEDITKLLYPNDADRKGKLMRVRQQYVLVSASLQDMLRSYRARFGSDYSHFAELYAVQLNDTHPTMAIPELVRLLTADGMGFDAAFDIARGTFNYTNHTVMREALECWDMSLLNAVAPDMVRALKLIDRRCRRELRRAKADIEAMAPVRGGQAHMADLAVYASGAVNGVAEIHSGLLKTDVFREWYALHPERFRNKTNGITQRRWLGLCNPELCALLDETVGAGYLNDLDRLSVLRDHIDDDLARRFIEVKREKKRQLAALVARREGVDLPEDFVFCVQVKRLHEYKRQLLNAFGIWDIYCDIKAGELADLPPVAFIFGAKSAPGYARAKAVICFINRIAAIINADPEVRDRLRVVFVQDYNCSYAEAIIPAADISEQISPAGTEASGTGNMKLMLNGAVTLGTRDGANIEIFEQAGEENNYPFGATVEELAALSDTYDPKAIYEADPRIRRALDALTDGTAGESPVEAGEGSFEELRDSLLIGASWHKPDHYYLLHDFPAYRAARLQAIRDTRDELAFAKKCLANIAGAGKFSSDRTIREYAEEIWRV